MGATDLGAFQREFAAALLDPSRPMPPAFAVYRNTVVTGCVDALRANYPAVARLVGDEWFRAAAAVYARAHPPRLPMLLAYGESFADFLAAFEPAAELPYLPSVARLDRFWTEAHVAADAPPLESGALARLAPERLGELRLRPHPSARWAWFDLPAFMIWSRQREGDDADLAISNDGEGALIVRPRDAVRWQALDRAGCAFLDACRAGETLSAAAEAALAADAGADLAPLMARLIEAGALTTSESKEETWI